MRFSSVLGSLCFAGLLSAAAPGCSHFLEARTIKRFADAMAQDDLDALKAQTTEEFEQKALRLDESLKDLKILRLPTGEAEIIAVKDVSDSEKLVKAEVGETKKVVHYRLKKDAQNSGWGVTESWVVDDVYITQKRDNVTATRPVTEQMDLLLTVREFVTDWRQGRPQESLDLTAPELRAQLEPLPPELFAKLAVRTFGEEKSTDKFRPEANIDEEDAIVKLPRKGGDIYISMKSLDGAWKVTDVAAESKEPSKNVPSLLKTAGVLLSASRFVDAYQAGDKTALESLCTKGFYGWSIGRSDLSQAALPVANLRDQEYDLELHGPRADVTVRHASGTCRFNLVQDESAGESKSAPFRIEEVTLFEADGQQQKQLSALFTSQAMVKVFSEALATRNQPMLVKSATNDFNQRVWDRVTHEVMRELPLGDIPPAAPTIESTAFKSSLTEVTVTQGDVVMTYVLRNRNGELRVDDIVTPSEDGPRSLKRTLELQLPAQLYAAALPASKFDVLQRNSSSDMNRIVWKQTERVPYAAQHVENFLRLPLQAVKELDVDHAELVLGDGRRGARIHLAREQGVFVVDDILLIAGPQPDQRIALRDAMRDELASYGRGRTPARPVQTALLPADGAPVVDQPVDLPAPSDDAFASPASGVQGDPSASLDLGGF